MLKQLERGRQGCGGMQTTAGNVTLGSNKTASRTAGGIVGADYRFLPFKLADLRWLSQHCCHYVAGKPQ